MRLLAKKLRRLEPEEIPSVAVSLLMDLIRKKVELKRLIEVPPRAKTTEAYASQRVVSSIGNIAEFYGHARCSSHYSAGTGFTEAADLFTGCFYYFLAFKGAALV
jgi:hypothetical protein